MRTLAGAAIFGILMVGFAAMLVPVDRYGAVSIFVVCFLLGLLMSGRKRPRNGRGTGTGKGGGGEKPKPSPARVELDRQILEIREAGRSLPARLTVLGKVMKLCRRCSGSGRDPAPEPRSFTDWEKATSPAYGEQLFRKPGPCTKCYGWGYHYR